MTQGTHGMKSETGIESAKAAGAITLGFASAATMNQVLAVVTILYVLLQAAYLIWKWRREARRGVGL